MYAKSLPHPILTTLPARLAALGLPLLLAACASVPLPKAVVPAATAPASSAPCHCPADKPVPPPAAPAYVAASFADLPAWADDDHAAALAAFVAQCTRIEKQPLWRSTCSAARAAGADARGFFESQFRVWQLQNPDGSADGLVTGYYEPLLRGSRTRQGNYTVPVFAAPDDLVVVDLGELYPELKHLRLRGRLEGRKLVPYYSRAEWNAQEARRKPMLWVDDALDFFFMQVQGSGQVVLADGSRIRLGYADQNGHPYRSIGRWLVDQGELKLEQASMQGIRAWAEANPKRLNELLNANPSLVFFRELAAEGSGPPGALGVPLTPERSIAVDPRHTPLGSPVWLATTHPGLPANQQADMQSKSEQPLNRLMLAQDTGGAIRGPVRADFYWGSGSQPGLIAGRTKQSGRMWVLLPRAHTPSAAQTGGTSP